MAKDVSKKAVWIFDGATQAEGRGNGGVFDHPIYIKYITFDTSDASADGQFSVHDKSGGTRIAPDYDYVQADRTPPFQYVIEDFVDGIYITSLPTGGRVLVAHGR